MNGTDPVWQSPGPGAVARVQQPGPIVRRARQDAGLTLAELGVRCGYSASTVSRLERGKQPLRDIVVLASIAEALRIPPEVLGLARRPRRHAAAGAPCSPALAAGAVRVVSDSSLGDGEDPVRRRNLLAGFAGLAAGAALGTPPAHADLSSPAGLAGDLTSLLYGPGAGAAEPLPLPLLRTALTAARADFQAARYRKLSATLPALLSTAAATRAVAKTNDQPTADALLADAYLIASNLMVKVNADQLAWATADRPVQAAQHGDDPLTLADARRGIATVLRRTGHAAAAQDLVLAAAHAIEPSGATTGDRLSMYGTLLAVAAYTAAVDGNRSAAQHLITESGSTASRLGRDSNHRFTAFGPANVALYRVSIAQVLGDSGTAIRHASTIQPSALPTPERRGRYWIDLARAYHQWGKHPQCYQALCRAEQAAPADVRYRPPVHRMVEDLLRSDRRRALPDLPALAQRIGLDRHA